MMPTTLLQIYFRRRVILTFGIHVAVTHAHLLQYVPARFGYKSLDSYKNIWLKAIFYDLIWHSVTFSFELLDPKVESFTPLPHRPFTRTCIKIGLV